MMDFVAGDEDHKIVSLNGVVPVGFAPDPDVVARLRGLLQQAESGAIGGIAYVVIVPGEKILTNWLGSSDCHRMAAGIGLLFHRYFATMEAGSVDILPDAS